MPKPKQEGPIVKSLKVRGIVAVAANGDYRMIANDEAKTEAKLYEELARDGWTIEPGEFVGIFETTITVTLPPAIHVKIPPLELTLSNNKNEDDTTLACSSEVEPAAHNGEVAGSNPAGPTNAARGAHR